MGYSFRKNLLGGEVEFAFYDIDKSLAENLAEELYIEGLRLQKIFNNFDDSSELFLLNKKRELKVSKELLEVLKESLKYSELTDGKYDVSKGKQFLERKKDFFCRMLV